MKPPRFLYILTRDLPFFDLPGLRKLKCYVFAKYLLAPGIMPLKGSMFSCSHAGPNVVKIGANLHVGSYATIDLSGTISIEDDVTISDGAKIYTHSHSTAGVAPRWRTEKPVFFSLTICKEAWIGASAIVLANCSRVGRGAIIAAGSIVTKDVPDYAIVAGNPAKIIRYRQAEVMVPRACDPSN